MIPVFREEIFQDTGNEGEETFEPFFLRPKGLGMLKHISKSLVRVHE